MERQKYRKTEKQRDIRDGKIETLISLSSFFK
jgi:hypothetical protein